MKNESDNGYIMSPAHQRWEEFMDRLEGPEGCNCQPDPDAPCGLTWHCDHSTTHARRILEDMGADVEASLSGFEEFGGYCDCEIVLNYALHSNEDRLAALRAAVDEDIEAARALPAAVWRELHADILNEAERAEEQEGDGELASTALRLGGRFVAHWVAAHDLADCCIDCGGPLEQPDG